MLAVAVTTSLALSVPAAGAGILIASHTGPHASLSLSRSSGTATVPVKVSGGGFGGSEKVSVFFGSTRMAVTHATRAGRFGPVTIGVPAWVSPGTRYRLWARGWTTNRTASDTFTVPADGASWPQYHDHASQDGYDNAENELSAGDVRLLKLKWRDGVGGILSTTSPVVAKGVVYTTPQANGPLDPPVVAISAAKGGVSLWTARIPAAATAQQPLMDPTPAVSGGTVYVGSDSNVFYAFSAATGKQKWSFQIPFTSGAQPAFTSATVADGEVFFGAGGLAYYALNAATGAEIWKYQAGVVESASPAVANGVVYLPTAGLVALDAVTGHVVWKNPYGHMFTSAPAMAKGMVYATDNAGSLLAFDASTGTKVWTASIGGTGSSPAVANGIVYTGSTDGDLYAFNTATGQQRWSFPVGSGLVSAPSVANGVVYIGANSQERVYALDAATGRKLWSYNLSSAGPNERVQSSPAVADGVLYVNAGNLYAFGL
jgi:outer membrane protein assembly factor BamB